MSAGRATALARSDRHGGKADFTHSPVLDDDRVLFLLHEHAARAVRVFGSWDGWAEPGLEACEVEPGVWQAELARPAGGRYAYKFQVDGTRWLVDHANPARAHDGFGGFNSLLSVG